MRRLLVGSLLIAASIVPTIVHSSGTTFREIFDFSWQYALSPANAAKSDRMAMADPTIDQERNAERERMREGIRKAVVTLRNLPLPEFIATLPTELTSPPELPVELVCDALARAAEETGLPPAFFARLIWQESKFKQRVVSHAGARGVAQFMPGTAVQFGLHNPFDPIASVAASGRFLRQLFEQFGNIGLAAAAYNAGPRRIQDWLAQRGKMPEETRNYVKIITGQPIEKWTERAEIDVASHLPARAPCEGVLGLSRVASADRIPVQMTPAIAKLIDEAKERVAKAKAAQLAKKEKANAARLAKLKKDNEKTKSADKDGGGKGKRADAPKFKVANAD
ncbi:MAG TPA: lytic transglycosylase domain-containing protein [Pseudorhodoplanes sp.]|nr:lytic transglycosylase domain-containing protein [Pseudorhodoplanes sp.]